MFQDNDSFDFKKNRKTIELNLTPLIDAFTVIVLFLVVGAIFSSSDITLFPNMRLPLSKSSTSHQTAPQLILFENRVKMTAIEEEFKLSDFTQNTSHVRAQLKKYIKGLSSKQKETGMMLNFTADQSTAYKNVFDIVKIFREEGFETVMFIGEGESK